MPLSGGLLAEEGRERADLAGADLHGADLRGVLTYRMQISPARV
ncbi:pentapeptide repeat-containing protein [Nonomuraea aurantiaca]|nr:pentapeptide repeat-containing protein [Nonomuraea aurantiaca]